MRENMKQNSINKLLKKWQNKSIEEGGGYMTPSAIEFAIDFKKTIKNIAHNNNIEMVKFNIGHYYVYGVLKKDDEFIYFSRDIERYNTKINLLASGCMDGILIRNANNESDFRGGKNNFCNISSLEKVMNSLFEKPQFF